MDITLKNKVAIVTGGTRGIGFAIVKKFIEAQAKVVVIWGSRKETAEAALEKLKEIFPDCEALAMAPSLSDHKQVKQAMEEVVSRYGRIDILSNNAGISQSIALEDYTDEDIDKIMDLNIKAVFVCSQAAAAHMKETGGSIINTSSVVSFYGQGLGCMYPASKSAVNGLTRSLSRELGQYGIRVNAVAPGVTRTDMVAALPESMVAPLLKKIPLARMGEAEDIANAALFLASDMASYITGAIIPVDGGAII